ncbi:MAG: TolC family protein [Bryobacteraceae bacterium]
MKYIVLFLLAAFLSQAEVYTLSLPQALEIASRQNPDVALARLDEQRSRENVRVVHDPFVPKVIAGSGAAYTYGYPNTINGNAPSIVTVQTQMAIYNKPRSYLVAAARENARGTQIDAQQRADEVAFQIAGLFLDVQDAKKRRATLESQLPTLRQVSDVIRSRVSEGSELPVENTRAKVNLSQSEHELNISKATEDYSEMLLAVALGYSANDRVIPVEPGPSFQLPPIGSEDDSVGVAIRRSKELKRLESAVFAKQLEIRSYRAARLPQVDLVAQYSLFAKYAYDQYFPGSRFQYNNAQIGAAFTIPLLVGSASGGQYGEAQTEIAKLRIQINQARNRITEDTRKSYQDMQSAQESRDLARQQLDLAHQDLSVLLSRYAEGQAHLTDVEKARAAENERWLALYQTETQYERSKLAVLRQLGDLMASLRIAAPDASEKQQP